MEIPMVIPRKYPLEIPSEIPMEIPRVSEICSVCSPSADSGMDLSEDDRASVDILLDRLEEVGDTAPLDNPLLWGNYDVAYVSSGKSQRGNPAGGRFRGKLGKALFQTNILEQNLYSPDVVVNKVRWSYDRVHECQLR